MTSIGIIGKLKKIGAILIAFVMCAAYTVRADQQFVLTVGETMVIPCLLEVWSDQSVNCVISNPEVIMSDGSGRAVIALAEGVSDVYVHMTNPDTDIRYTFVVEPAQRWEAAEGWNLPGETAIDGGVLGSDEPHVNDENASPGEADAVAGSRDDRAMVSGETGADSVRGAGDETQGISSGTRAEAHMPEDSSAGPGTEAHMPEDGSADPRLETHIPEDSSAGPGTEAQKSEDNIADSQAEIYIPDTDDHGTGGTAESVPFWEERGSGGISFVVIEDDFAGKTVEEGDIIDYHGARYKPFAYLNADGEVVPLFVCAAGREVRWKYIGRILYIEASSSYTGPYRVSALDSRGNICYFSS